MNKRYYRDSDLLKLLHHGIFSNIYKLKDGKVLKIINKEYIGTSNRSLEKKILLSQQFTKIPSLVLPKEIVYNCNDEFCGYTMNHVKGNPISNIWYLPEDKIRSTIGNISSLTEKFLKIEKAVKKLNENGIIVPDLLTEENIFFTENGSLKLLDYDGMQVYDMPTFSISSNLGNQSKYLNSKKYFDEKTCCYTDQLDKKSLILLYIELVLGFQFEKSIDTYLEKEYSLDDIIDELFETCGLNDDDLKHKIWKLYQENEDNEFIGEDAKRIADEYIVELEYVAPKLYQKHFKRK